MIGSLLVIAGPDTNVKFELDEGQVLSVGRGADTATRLKDPQVSRKHCEIKVEGGRIVLTDLGSAAGTMVNGKRVTTHTLRSGDVIQIGGTQMRLHSEGPSEHDASTVLIGASSRPKDGPDAGEELVGKKISHYLIGPILARGTTGIIFKATDEQHNTEVAFKVLRSIYATDDDEMQRFVRAMKTMLPLRHPNLVSLLGAGRVGNYCWMAMEFVDGESLDKVIERIGIAGMLDWRYALRVAIHIARALEYAHGQNSIHRNITPTNIIVRSSDKVAKLSDLMFAKALEGTHAKHVTRPGELIGEVAYMAPERTHGGAADVDGRSDIYGLGATVYALLTGRPPFEGTSLIDTVQKIRSAEPVKPKKYQLSTPDLFEGVVMQMLAKRPQDRQASATELLTSLERVAKFQGISV
ncbi:MAG TPA: FHA domain-containing serine/threonine-protein kinase [Gemmatales bacterium]|nr:FHA domain-containing serine/threonine-protein kinase [Gemmatales bacterium]HMP60207.1 FHA domain-containing serine/threonine-protein kinase [Gemmatales bacterium]